MYVVFLNYIVDLYNDKIICVFGGVFFDLYIERLDIYEFIMLKK